MITVASSCGVRGAKAAIVNGSRKERDGGGDECVDIIP